ncbi:hypothetical protein LCGC14_2948330, partial [marine sediment metagenome]
GLSPSQCRAYQLADNQIPLLAEWDDALLAEALAGIADAGLDLAVTGFSDDELAERRKGWAGPRATNYQSGALWKYAKLVGPTYLGAVTHPGAQAETHDYMDL